MTALPLYALLLQAPGGRGMIITLGMYAAIFAIFYFILIRPQQQQRKTHEATIQSLKKGDEVVTTGGLVGRVITVKETYKDGQATKTPEDLVTIESGTARVVVERGRIARIRGVAGTPASGTVTTS